VAGVLRADQTVLPESGERKAAMGLERMLHMYFLANEFNLADETCGKALCDIPLFESKPDFRTVHNDMS
jgi:hypothetical protein